MAHGQPKEPIVYVIAGPNGAGKTTFATEFLPGFANCLEFLNADLIAAGLAPFAPATQSLRAGRLLLDRIAELRERRSTFGFETTLSGKSYAKLLREMKSDGYRVVIYFLWLPTAEMAIDRVSIRVKRGGHHVPDEDVRRRHRTGLSNFFRLYSEIASDWCLVDGSRMPAEFVASRIDGTLEIDKPDLFAQIRDQSEE